MDQEELRGESPSVWAGPMWRRMAVVLGITLTLPTMALPWSLAGLDRLLGLPQEVASVRAEEYSAQGSEQAVTMPDTEETSGPTVGARAQHSSAELTQGPSPEGEAAGGSPPEPFANPYDRAQARAIQARLKELGAAYFALDYFPRDDRYRFRCEVELPGASPYRRPFEASAGQPLEAMWQVCAAVEGWQARAEGPATR